MARRVEQAPATAVSGEGEQQETPERRAGGFALWFAALGGAVAWTVHLMLAWLFTELPCRQAHRVVLGLTITGDATVLTVVPGVVAVLALVVSLRAGRALREPVGRREARAKFMATVGAWMNGLAILMIVFGGIAVATISPCVVT